MIITVTGWGRVHQRVRGGSAPRGPVMITIIIIIIIVISITIAISIVAIIIAIIINISIAISIIIIIIIIIIVIAIYINIILYIIRVRGGAARARSSRDPGPERSQGGPSHMCSMLYYVDAIILCHIICRIHLYYIYMYIDLCVYYYS